MALDKMGTHLKVFLGPVSIITGAMEGMHNRSTGRDFRDRMEPLCIQEETKAEK